VKRQKKIHSDLFELFSLETLESMERDLGTAVENGYSCLNDLPASNVTWFLTEIERAKEWAS